MLKKDFILELFFNLFSTVNKNCQSNNGKRYKTGLEFIRRRSVIHQIRQSQSGENKEKCLTVILALPKLLLSCFTNVHEGCSPPIKVFACETLMKSAKIATLE